MNPFILTCMVVFLSASSAYSDAPERKFLPLSKVRVNSSSPTPVASFHRIDRLPGTAAKKQKVTTPPKPVKQRNESLENAQQILLIFSSGAS